MKTLFLAILISFLPTLGPPAQGMTCEEVREVAETVLDADHLDSDDQYWILEGLFGNFYQGCTNFVEDAQD